MFYTLNRSQTCCSDIHTSPDNLGIAIIWPDTTWIIKTPTRPKSTTQVFPHAWLALLDCAGVCRICLIDHFLLHLLAPPSFSLTGGLTATVTEHTCVVRGAFEAPLNNFAATSFFLAPWGQKSSKTRHTDWRTALSASKVQMQQLPVLHMQQTQQRRNISIHLELRFRPPAKWKFSIPSLFWSSPPTLSLCMLLGAKYNTHNMLFISPTWQKLRFSVSVSEFCSCYLASCNSNRDYHFLFPTQTSNFGGEI